MGNLPGFPHWFVSFFLFSFSRYLYRRQILFWKMCWRTISASRKLPSKLQEDIIATIITFQIRTHWNKVWIKLKNFFLYMYRNSEKQGFKVLITGSWVKHCFSCKYSQNYSGYLPANWNSKSRHNSLLRFRNSSSHHTFPSGVRILASDRLKPKRTIHLTLAD